MFSVHQRASFKDPGRARPRDRGRDDVLGFGTVEATLLTHETEGGLREALAGGVNGAAGIWLPLIRWNDPAAVRQSCMHTVRLTFPAVPHVPVRLWSEPAKVTAPKEAAR